MSESALKTFIRGSAISLVGTGFVGILNYFVRRTLCLELTSADYGAFYSALALLSMIYAFSDLGLIQSATTLIAKYAGLVQQHRIFNAFFMFRLTLALLTTAIIFLLAKMLSHKYLNITETYPILLLSILFFFQAVSGCFNSLYSGLKEFGTLQIVQVSGTLLLLTGVIFFCKSMISCCLIFTIEAILVFGGNTIYCLICRKIQILHAATKNEWSELIHLGGWLAVSSTLFTSLYYMDTVMLTCIKGVESSAQYNVALPIMQIVQAAMIFPAVMLPIAMDMSKRNDYAGLKRFALWGCLITIVLAPVFYLFFGWTGHWLICILFSEKYSAAASAVPLLCTALLFFTCGNFMVQLLISLNQIKTVVLISVICFSCNIVLNYILIHRFDFVGASAATLCSYFIFAFMSIFFLTKRFQKKVSEE